MTRGWESKSIEQQIEDARAESNRSYTKPNGPAETELNRKREGLRLQRSRILQELESARNPRYRKLLEEMLSHVDRQLT